VAIGNETIAWAARKISSSISSVLRRTKNKSVYLPCIKKLTRPVKSCSASLLFRRTLKRLQPGFSWHVPVRLSVAY
jgi:hypothetical protein